MTQKALAFLEEAGVDDDFLRRYIVDIAADNTLERAEAGENIRELLQEISLQSHTPEEIAAATLNVCRKSSNNDFASGDEMSRAVGNSETHISALEQVLQSVRLKGDTGESSKEHDSDGTRSEGDEVQRAIRRRLVERFGIQAESTVEYDESGQLVNTLEHRMETAGGSDLPPANDNRQRVKDAQQRQRDAAKLESQKEALRRAEQKKRDELKREKEKSRVAKKERRTGR